MYRAQAYTSHVQPATALLKGEGKRQIISSYLNFNALLTSQVISGGGGDGEGRGGVQAEWCNKSTGFALTCNFRFLPVKISVYWNKNQRSVAVILFDRFSIIFF